MAITNFQPEIWSAELQSSLKKSLVFAGSPVVNSNYQGTISGAGDSVRIVSISRPTIGTYTKDTDITVQVLTDADRAPWLAELRLLDGRLIECRFAPLSGGATMTAFRLRDAKAGPQAVTEADTLRKRA